MRQRVSSSTPYWPHEWTMTHSWIFDRLRYLMGVRDQHPEKFFTIGKWTLSSEYDALISRFPDIYNEVWEEHFNEGIQLAW